MHRLFANSNCPGHREREFVLMILFHATQLPLLSFPLPFLLKATLLSRFSLLNMYLPAKRVEGF